MKNSVVEPALGKVAGTGALIHSQLVDDFVWDHLLLEHLSDFNPANVAKARPCGRGRPRVHQFSAWSFSAVIQNETAYRFPDVTGVVSCMKVRPQPKPTSNPSSGAMSSPISVKRMCPP